MVTVDTTDVGQRSLILHFDTEFSFDVAANDIPQGTCIVFTLWSVDSMIFADKNGCLADGILFKRLRQRRIRDVAYNQLSEKLQLLYLGEYP